MTDDYTPSLKNAKWLSTYELVINDELVAAKPTFPDVAAENIEVADRPSEEWSASGQADANLTESVITNGVTRPIIVCRKKNEIIDGVRLYKIVRKLKLPYAVVYIDCEGAAAAALERVLFNIGTCEFSSRFARAWTFVNSFQPLIASWREQGRMNQAKKPVCPAPDKGGTEQSKIDWLQMAADTMNVSRSEIHYANVVRKMLKGERKSSYPPQKLQHDIERALRGEMGGFTIWTNIRCHNDRAKKDEKFDDRGNEQAKNGDGGHGALTTFIPTQGYQVVWGNTFKMVPALPPGFVDHFLFSPPYYLPTTKKRKRDISKTFYDLTGEAADWLKSWPAYQEGTRIYCQAIDAHLRGGRGGYVVINVANTMDSDGTQYCHTDLLRNIAADLGWFNHGEWIWAKGNISARKYRGGKADNPLSRINHEYVCVFRVGDPKRGPSTLFNKELKKFTLTDYGQVALTEIPKEWRFPSRWEIAPVSHKLHAAVFPRQLVYRCLQLWSGHGDMVCDPFCGVGTTGHVAALLGRRFVGIEQGKLVANIASKQITEAAEMCRDNEKAARSAIEKLATGARG